MDNPTCIFCDIASGNAPAHHILEDELAFAILDINPFARGHCLVLPKRHVAWWHDMTEAETASVFNLARVIANRMMKAFKPDFVMTYARGKRIPHTHIFLIPTSSGDVLDRYFNALEKIQEAPLQLAHLWAQSEMEDAARILREVE
ncbi:ATP adenylyltransferase [Anaerolineae bacterium]|nr:ATP adenylyltransferase [Anaerolineae bacterium]